MGVSVLRSPITRVGQLSGLIKALVHYTTCSAN